MRQRILDAIYQKLEENPENEQCRRQTVLIAKSNICTIHSFCLDVIRNNFYEISISPNFRIGEQTEIELLKQEVLEEVFEQKYEEQEENFLTLIHTYTGYRGDEPLKEMILKIDKQIQSNPFPEEWLAQAVEEFNLSTIEQDFSTTKWGQILLQTFQEELEGCVIQLKSIKEQLHHYPELEKFERTISVDLEKMEQLLYHSNTWESAYQLASEFKFDTWPRDKVTIEQKDIAKEKRDAVKKRFQKIRDKIMIYTSKQANEDMLQMYPVLKALKELLFEFRVQFAKKKQEKNVIDFNDIEHFALKILVTKNEQGDYVPTEVAKRYQEKFVEIAIDEYQDSNLVQEYILSTISKGNNIFMVGDVKQSIYRFRQARPELFITKYETYVLKEEQTQNQNLKIQLFKNFRSRENILDITNLVFSNIMSKELGDITYDEQEYLNLGAKYEPPLEETLSYAGKAELHILDLKENQEQEEENEEEVQQIENVVLEAKMVAKRMKELLNSKYQVYDKKLGYRDITYQDMVVLLRATSNLAPIYEKEISNLEIPVFSDTGSQYLDTVEIQTVLAILKVIDNPRQDIPLVTVLRSMVVGLDDNELMELKLAVKKKTCFYEVLLEGKEKVEEEIKRKVDTFLEQVKTWRSRQEYLPLDELIWQIYLDTGYYHYVSLMPNGALRQANLKLLFEKAKQYEKASFKGLFNFITFIDRLKMNSSDLDSAKLIGENENVVRIMSIHKSKGLEFPVVFLAGMGKKFNLQDLNENILLHQDIGLGPKYVNYERRIEYNTLAKEAIITKVRKETLSEEMRVLYVALTRAKEKLILSGISKDMQKDKKQKQEILQMYQQKQIHPNILTQYTSYLDWIELVLLNQPKEQEKLVTITIHEKQELLEIVEDKQENKFNLEEINKLCLSKKEEYPEIKNRLEWEYPNKIATTLVSKTSVTQIKQTKEPTKQQVEKQQYIKNLKEAKPKFMQEQETVSNARKGTLMHLCIQHLDETKIYTKEIIQQMIQQMVEKQLIFEQEAEAININQLLEYTNSNLFKELQQAKEIHKEQPFYIQIPAKEMYHEEVKENILVQGIIDLYYIDSQGKLVLVDYKTDRIKQSEQELIDNYQTQLQLYQRALEQALNKKIDKIWIYSTYLGKSIPINL